MSSNLRIEIIEEDRNFDTFDTFDSQDSDDSFEQDKDDDDDLEERWSDLMDEDEHIHDPDENEAFLEQEEQEQEGQKNKKPPFGVSAKYLLACLIFFVILGAFLSLHRTLTHKSTTPLVPPNPCDPGEWVIIQSKREWEVFCARGCVQVQRIAIRNSDIVSLSGCPSLWGIKTKFNIHDNHNLEEISPDLFPSLNPTEFTDTFQLNVYNNSKLINVTFSTIQFVHMSAIVSNPSLTHLAFPSLQSVTTSLSIVNNEKLEDLSLPSLEEISEFGLEGSSIVDFDGLNKIKTTKLISLSSNPQLKSISGFKNLNDITRQLILIDSPLLQNISVFSSIPSLTSLKLNNIGVQSISFPSLTSLAELILQNMPSLTSTSFDNLEIILDRLELNNATSLSSFVTFPLKFSGDYLLLTDLPSLLAIPPFKIEWSSVSEVVIINTGANNLEGLKTLEGGWLIKVSNNQKLTSLDGLNSLQALKGKKISEEVILPGLLEISDNPLLSSITALGSLPGGQGSIKLVNNSKLASLDGLGALTELWDLTLSGNPSLSSLQALENLTKANELTISSDPLLESDSLSSFSSLKLLSSLTLENLVSLDSLSAFPFTTSNVEKVTISSNPSLVSLEGLGTRSSLTSLSIIDNSQLVDLSGIEGLQKISNSLRVSENGRLTTLGPLLLSSKNNEKLDIYIEGNPVLNFDQSFIEESEETGSMNGLTIEESPLMQSIGFLPENVIFNQMTFNNNPFLVSFNGMLNNVNGSIAIAKNPSLLSLEGLETVVRLVNVTIHDNEFLSSLSALSNVVMGGGCEGMVSVYDNVKLSDCLDVLCQLCTDVCGCTRTDGNGNKCQEDECHH